MTTIDHSSPLGYNAQDTEGEHIRKTFERFLFEFEETSPEDNRSYKYYDQEVKKILANKQNTLKVNFRHLMKFSMELAEDILMDYLRFEPFLRKGLINYSYSLLSNIPKDQQLFVGFYHLVQTDGIREMKSGKLGRLLALKGTVTKVTEVRPELLVGSFKCQICNTKVGPIEQQFSYSTPKACAKRGCTNQMRFELANESSVFVDWQKIRLQELDSELPTGSTPRSIEVVLRADLAEQAQPGDRALVTGTLIVVPEAYSKMKPGEKHEMGKNAQGQQRVPGQKMFEGVTGLAKLGVKDLNYKLVFLANNVQINSNKISQDNLEHIEKIETVESLLDVMGETERQEILRIAKDPEVFDKLAALIAPSIYANKEIKKGILLMLLGGVNKRTREGMKIRGDLNVCIVGDPATAKSQFLQYVHRFIPRAVYTCGKGSTAAGLTASLTRDSETNEFVIEAGALILADNGICCIDEFDKMEEKDVVAIHEAMEQQTISLSKAGIQATLNARCSVIAAANPIMGRYDKTKTLKANINMAPPLMSRFDLFFVITDECDEKSDTILAKHMLQAHKNIMSSTAKNIEARYANLNDFEPKSSLSQMVLRRYIRFTKKLNPKITPEAAALLEKGYLRMRANELNIQKSAYRVTVRQLESLIRLSEAIAKVHLEMSVSARHVEMAFDLLARSMISITHPDMAVEDDEPEPQATQNGHPHASGPATTENGEAQQPNGSGQLLEEKLKEKKKKSLMIPHDKYERISKGLIHIMKEQANKPITRNDLTNLFLNSEVAKIPTMEKFIEHEKLIQVIIKRMTQVDKIFMIALDQGNDPNPTLVLHPQFLANLD